MIYTIGKITGQNSYTVGETIAISITLDTAEVWSGKWELLSIDMGKYPLLKKGDFSDSIVKINSENCNAGDYAVRLWFIFANGDIQIENIKIKLGA